MELHLLLFISLVVLTATPSASELGAGERLVRRGPRVNGNMLLFLADLETAPLSKVTQRLSWEYSQHSTTCGNPSKWARRRGEAPIPQSQV